MVELQDASSQVVAEIADARPGMTVLDYCAGGGGKTLALAAAMRGQGRLLAWDANPRRMADLPDRARRAGAAVRILSDAEVAALEPVCDLVLVDAPCSGTGAWRRKPEGKWRLTPAELAGYPPLQDAILDAAAARCGPAAGWSTPPARCSPARTRTAPPAFAARHPRWRPDGQRRLSPLDGGDGFFVAALPRARRAAEPQPPGAFTYRPHYLWLRLSVLIYSARGDGGGRAAGARQGGDAGDCGQRRRPRRRGPRAAAARCSSARR